VEAAIFDVIAGISSAEGNESIRLYPNPAGNELILQLNTEPADKIDCIIFDNIGKKVMSFKAGERITKTDISQLAKGNYTLEIMTSTDVMKHLSFMKE